MTFGPMQMLIVGFDGNEFKGEILPELRRLGDQDVVRLIDLLLVSKDENGEVTRLEISDLSERTGGRALFQRQRDHRSFGGEGPACYSHWTDLVRAPTSGNRPDVSAVLGTKLPPRRSA